MNFQTFKHLFAKTRRPSDAELWQAKDGVLSCPMCFSLAVKVSDAPDIQTHGHCSSCKLTANLNQFMTAGLDEKYHCANVTLPLECPDCGPGSSLIMRDGKYGLFIGCSNYPTCKVLYNVSTRVETF